jgi:pyridoxine 5-phosphate synthase
VLEVLPDQVTLVPDAHDAITSNAGWDTLKNREFLTDICARFKKAGIRTSIFIDPDPDMAEGAARCGADRVELYTADYAAEFPLDPEIAVARYLETAKAARTAGLGLNAGHDLNLDNLAFFIKTIPWTDEVSIGHALISDALYMGLEKTIQAYLGEIRKK